MLFLSFLSRSFPDRTWYSRLFYALFIPYVYIQIYANFRGVSPNISNYLLAILNAMNVPSRVLPGLLADRYGA